MISDYFRDVELRIRNAEIIADKKVDFSEFGPDEGMLPGRLLFVDGSMLEFMEYLHRERRLKYRFHGYSQRSIALDLQKYIMAS